MTSLKKEIGDAFHEVCAGSSCAKCRYYSDPECQVSFCIDYLEKTEGTIDRLEPTYCDGVLPKKKDLGEYTRVKGKRKMFTVVQSFDVYEEAE